MLRRLPGRRATFTSTASPRSLEGHCLCGSISITIAPGATPSHDPAYCHCNHCRRFHGSPFALEAGWALESIELSGKTVNYATSEHFERHRCAICGTPCAGIHRKLGAAFVPSTLLVDAGEDLPQVLKPKMHMFYSRRIVGEMFKGDGLAKYDEFPT